MSRTFMWTQNQAMYLILRLIPSSGSTEGALEEAGREEHKHIITDAAPNELKPDEGAYSDERGPSARW